MHVFAAFRFSVLVTFFADRKARKLLNINTQLGLFKLQIMTKEFQAEFALRCINGHRSSYPHMGKAARITLTGRDGPRVHCDATVESQASGQLGNSP